VFCGNRKTMAWNNKFPLANNNLPKERIFFTVRFFPGYYPLRPLIYFSSSNKGIVQAGHCLQVYREHLGELQNQCNKASMPNRV